ncbi:hypothetical protein QF047_004484 [Arthrobacter sp. W4I7]|nr:hypothetical protein [Arthrobacter sp. W4I7]
MALGPLIAGRFEGVCLAGQGSVGGDALRDRDQRGQVGHGFRCRAQADGPFRHGMGSPFREGLGVAPVGGGADGGGDGPVPAAGQGAGVRGDFFVHRGPVFGGQAGGFLHDQDGPPLAQLPALKCRERVGHLGDQGFPQSQQPAAACRGLSPGQGDLRAYPGTKLIGGHARGGLFPPHLKVIGNGNPGLFRGDRGLHVLEFPHLINLSGAVLSDRNSSQQCKDTSNRRHSTLPHRDRPCR